MTDLVIAGARIVDGSGAPGFEGTVLVSGGRIEGVVRGGGDVPDGAPTIHAAGRVLAPGFVDVHNHSDLSPLIEPQMDSFLRQGVTTLVVGNCGWSAAPRAALSNVAEMSGLSEEEARDLRLDWKTHEEYLERVDAAHPAINVATLVGHGGVRTEVMGMERRPPTADEITEMKALVEEGMRAGAVGLSTGLVYHPSLFATEDEIVELAKVVEPFGGLYASHIRSEGEFVFEAVSECIRIGQRAGVGSHVSHLKVETDLMWGRAPDLLDLVHAGEDVSTDQYPYTAWETNLNSFLPPWAPVGELGAALATDRDHLREVVLTGEGGWQSSVRGIGWDRVVVVGHPRTELTGSTIAAIAEEEGDEDAFDTFCRLLLEDPATSVVGHGMDEADVRTIVAQPDIMVASDGLAIAPTGPLGRFNVHPRYYGTFPRVLGRYVREGKLLSLESAVRKMTSLPADRFMLGDRGRIHEGAIADLVLFDAGRVIDRATFETPHAFPEGIDAVVVAGRVAWDGTYGERPGVAIRRSA